MVGPDRTMEREMGDVVLHIAPSRSERPKTRRSQHRRQHKSRIYKRTWSTKHVGKFEQNNTNKQFRRVFACPRSIAGTANFGQQRRTDRRAASDLLGLTAQKQPLKVKDKLTAKKQPLKVKQRCRNNR